MHKAKCENWGFDRTPLNDMGPIQQFASSVTQTKQDLRVYLCPFVTDIFHIFSFPFLPDKTNGQLTSLLTFALYLSASKSLAGASVMLVFWNELSPL